MVSTISPSQTTIVPGGMGEGREFRRWEFMRLPYETRKEIVQEEKVCELLES